MNGGQHLLISTSHGTPPSRDTSSDPAAHCDEWKTPQFNRTGNSPLSLRNAALIEDKDGHVPGSRTEWTELDFPPLGDPKGDRKSSSGVWGEKKPSPVEVETEDQADRFVLFLAAFNHTLRDLPATKGPRALPQLRLL